MDPVNHGGSGGLRSCVDFETSNRTFREIMGNGLRYAVPRFQRDYAWTQDQWLDLWEDAQEAGGPRGNGHYMGSIVLQRSEDPKSFTLIDGQQRLTTLSLLVIALMFELKAIPDPGPLGNDRNDARLTVLRNSYLETEDAVSLRRLRKLHLNRNNDAFFRDLARLNQPTLRLSRATERLLHSACGFFRTRLRESFASSAERSAFVDGLADRALFTTITVGDELDAYRVFSTLNARGVGLSSPDLLKSLVFSRMDQNGLHTRQLDELDERWAEIGTQLGHTGITGFVLDEWNRRNPPVRDGSLFRAVRDSLPDATTASAFFDRLHRAAPVYAALHQPEDELWQELPDKLRPRVRRHLRALDVFDLREPLGLLLTVWEAGDLKSFEKVLRWAHHLGMRHRVIGGGSSHAFAHACGNGSRAFLRGGGTDAVRDQLHPLYPDDKTFSGAFERHAIASGSAPLQARFLLGRLEEQANGNHRVRDDDLTLEHILPQNPDADWYEAFGDHAEKDIDRLGNMALLTRGQNAQLGRADYATKKAALAATGLHVNELDADSWDHEAVERRQRRLAELAVQAWRIDFD